MNEYQRLDAREEYLTSQIYTATPQKLQLLLIEGALKNCLRARDDYQVGEFLAAGEPLIKAQSIVTEILSTAKLQSDNPLSQPIVSLYAYLFRTLVLAYMNHDLNALNDVITILHEERETWQLVNERLAVESKPQTREDLQASSGFSFEA